MNDLYDIVICVGPNDYSLIETLISNVKVNIINQNIIYILTHKKIVDQYSSLDPSVKFIDESIFPFSKTYIDDLFKAPKQSGWYLQQLLKLYAPIVIEELLDNYILLDADVYFHRPVSFFKDNKIQFNVGSEYHEPYFEHMTKLHPSLYKTQAASGICHVMPMKRHIVKALFKMIESYHNDIFWKVFLNNVTPDNYSKSGASEYEILFTYTTNIFLDEFDIVPLHCDLFAHYINREYKGVYQACHWYCRN